MDFGEGFKVIDKDGEEPHPFIIDHISKADPGVVTLHKERPHNFNTGDFICLYDVEGMTEVNGSEPRPVRVVDQYSFQIENTTDFRNYEKGGIAQLVKVPFRIHFKSIIEFIANPDYNAPIYENNMAHLNKSKHLHLVLMALFEYFSLNKQMPNITKQEDEQQFLALLTKINLKNQHSPNIYLEEIS